MPTFAGSGNETGLGLPSPGNWPVTKNSIRTPVSASRSCLLPLNGEFSNKSESSKILICVCRLLFCATTLMAALHCWRTRNERSGKHDPAMEVHTHNTHTHTSHV